MVINMENEWLHVELSSHGAELRRVKHKENKLDYMWSGDSNYWGRISPVLFPIVGRLKDDQYQLNNKTYHMSQHGFLRDVAFDIDKQTSTSVSFVFASDRRFTSMYPYEFKAFIHYTLEENELRVQWEIVNENEEEMYFSIGGHPAFKIPLLENESLEDYHVQLIAAPKSQVKSYELEGALIYEKGLVHGDQMIPLSPAIFKNDALIYENIQSAKLVSSKSRHSVELFMEGFPFIGVWSKYLDDVGEVAPFLCLEPWYGIADTLDSTGDYKEKLGINQLDVGEVFQAAYRIKFE